MTTWVLVADSSRARFFSADTAMSGLTEIDTLVHPAARAHDNEMASDEPGVTFDRNGQGLHAMGHEVSPKQQEAIRFAKDVSTKLNSARQAGKYHKLYVIAAPAFLGTLRNSLKETTKRYIAGEIDKDLTAFDIADIRDHLPRRL